MAKYHSRKVVKDGITFDSAKEARRFAELSLLERAGAIAGLQRQVRFELIPSQRVGGKVVERPVTYIADFVYREGGETVVEDVKGFRTKEYELKKKLMAGRGIHVVEV